jgi:hypothetical protein
MIRNRRSSGNHVFTFSHIFIGMTNAAITATLAAIGLPARRSNHFWTSRSPSLPRLARADAARRQSGTGLSGVSLVARHLNQRRRQIGFRFSTQARMPSTPPSPQLWTDALVWRQRDEYRQSIGADRRLIHPPRRHRGFSRFASAIRGALLSASPRETTRFTRPGSRAFSVQITSVRLIANELPKNAYSIGVFRIFWVVSI